MDLARLSVDELIAASAELEERAGGLFDRLAGVTARASANGVEVEVNLDGMIVGLELSADALRLGAERLAAEIFRLTQEASGSALAKGMAILEPVAGPELMSLIQEPEVTTTAAADDYSTVESWALPR
jgi:hypothetical protein